MLFHHRTSFFPLVLALLTLLLMGLMLFAFSGKQTTNKQVTQEISPVSSEEYKESMRTLIVSFVEEFPKQKTQLAKKELVEKTLATLLSLRVPAAEKSRHLALAVELNQMLQSLILQDGKEQELFVRFIPYVSY